MADVNEIPWFRAVWHAGGIVPDTLDSGYRPDYLTPWADVTFTPHIVDGANRVVRGEPQLRLTNHAPPLTLMLVPFAARLEDGVLKLPRLPAPAGENPTPTEVAEQEAAEGVEMVANSTVLQLQAEHKLVYEVSVGTMKLLGKQHQFDPMWFAAPTVDDYVPPPGDWTPPVVDLTTVTRFVPTP